jgi:hypothetical protein
MSETKKHTLWFDPISQLDGTGLIQRDPISPDWAQQLAQQLGE